MNVHFSGFKPDGLAYLTAEHAADLKNVAVRANDVLLNITGASIGRVTVAPESMEDARVNQHVCIIRPKPELHPKFLAYFLASPLEQGRVMNVQVGVTRQALTKGMIENWEIPLPPLPEQRRIVAEIEKQFTRLDAGIAALRNVQAKLKRYRAAVLKAACEGLLVPTEAELAKKRKRQFESGRELLQANLSNRRDWFERQTSNRKKKYREPATPSIDQSLPEGWALGTWDQLSNWVTYGFTRPMPHVGAGVPITTAKSVKNRRIDFENCDFTTNEAHRALSEKDRPKSGDILITKDGTIGRAAVVETEKEFCINQSVAVVWLRSCTIDRKWLLTVIESELTQKPIWAKARGVAIQHLSITDFAKLRCRFPHSPNNSASSPKWSAA